MSKFKNLKNAVVYVVVQIQDKISCIQIRQTLTISTDADRSTHTMYYEMSYNQKCPGYSNLGVILLREKMQKVYLFVIIGHFTRSLNDTCQLMFCDYMHNNLVGEKCTPFFNCVITGHSQVLNIIILKFNPPVLLNLLGNIFPYCPAVGPIRRINSYNIDLPGRSMLDL